MISGSFSRPVKAKLVLQFDNGETIDAEPEHLEELNYVNADQLANRFKHLLVKLVEHHTSDTAGLMLGNLGYGGTPFFDYLRDFFDSVVRYHNVHDDKDIVMGEEWSYLKLFVALDKAYRTGDLISPRGLIDDDGEVIEPLVAAILAAHNAEASS